MIKSWLGFNEGILYITFRVQDETKAFIEDSSNTKKYINAINKQFGLKLKDKVEPIDVKLVDEIGKFIQDNFKCEVKRYENDNFRTITYFRN